MGCKQARQVNSPEKVSSPEIVVASRLKQFKEVQRLLKHGHEVNARDLNGETALHWAAYWGSQRTIKILVELRADINARSKCGWTPLWMAQSGNQSAAEYQLLEFLREQNLPLNAPSLKGSPSKITNNIEPKRRLLEEKKMLVVSSLQTKAPSRDQTVRSASDMPENRLDNPIAEVIRDKDLHVGTQRGFPTEKTKRIETTHWLDQESKRREIESRLQWTEEILGEIVGENQELRQRMLEILKVKHDLEEKCAHLQRRIVELNSSMDLDPGSPIEGTDTSLQIKKELEEATRSLDNLTDVLNQERKTEKAMLHTLKVDHNATNSSSLNATNSSSLLDYLKSPERSPIFSPANSAPLSPREPIPISISPINPKPTPGRRPVATTENPIALKMAGRSVSEFHVHISRPSPDLELMRGKNGLLKEISMKRSTPWLIKKAPDDIRRTTLPLLVQDLDATLLRWKESENNMQRNFESLQNAAMESSKEESDTNKASIRTIEQAQKNSSLATAKTPV